MTTFDLVQVQDFLAGLDARMAPDVNGARDSHAELGTALRDHAALCHELAEEIRAWGRAVFSTRVEFDPDIESAFLAEGARLSARAGELLGLAVAAEATGVSLDGSAAFRAAVERMNHLLQHWIRPQRSVGPGPRHWRHATPAMVEEARRRIADLPALPVDWPLTAEQRQALGIQ